MQEELKKALSTLFIGTIPEPLEAINISLDDILELIGKQGAKNAKDINYALLIEDTLQIISKSSGDAKPLTLQSLIEHQYFNRRGLKSLYYKIIQDKDVSMFAKLEMACFYRNLIQTTTSIYGIDIMHGQEAFIQELTSDEQKYQALIDEYNELLRAIDEDQEDELSAFWRYTPEQLVKVSEQLYEAGFTNDAEDFYKAFSKSLTNTYDWKKKKTALIYLFGLLYIDSPAFPDRVFKFIQSTFTINGKPTTIEILRVQFKQVEDKLNLKGSQLKEQFLSLHTIYQSMFKKP